MRRARSPLRLPAHPAGAIAAAGAALILCACGSADGDGVTVASDPAADTASAAATLEETNQRFAPAEPGADCPTDGEEWEVAKLYIEHNATDADTGVHGLFGGDAWSLMCITDPTGTTIFIADPLANFDGLSVADLFFESREPPNDEYTLDLLRTEFPAGEYTVGGIDFEGTPRIGTAVFTHDIPAEPEITSPPIADGAGTVAEATVPATGLVVEWEPVTETIDGTPVTITGYEVIITDERSEDPNGFARPIYDVHVPDDQLGLSVPDDFLRPGTLHELEVLAIEESGNQTISVGFFMTA